MPYCPFRHFPHPVTQVGFVRLACLIHAANVRSEPGSNPSKVAAFSRPLAGTGSRIYPSVCPDSVLKSVAIGHDSKNIVSAAALGGPPRSKVLRRGPRAFRRSLALASKVRASCQRAMQTLEETGVPS